jgi:dihydrofolate reductase
MRKVLVNEFMTLDGVVQAPGGADEDPSGGFKHGGWHMPYMDDVAQTEVLEGINEAGGFLLGRRTYEIFAAYWPNAPEEDQVIAEPLNTKPKYVASTAPDYVRESESTAPTASSMRPSRRQRSIGITSWPSSP